jgi:Zn-dependent peptidase ImmA (M78 family)
MKFLMQIGTAKYYVSEEKNMIRDTRVMGVTHTDAKTITLDESLRREQPDLFAQTFIHEVLHAAMHEYGTYPADKEEEERIVDSLAMTLVLLRSNKGFLKAYLGVE